MIRLKQTPYIVFVPYWIDSFINEHNIAKSIFLDPVEVFKEFSVEDMNDIIGLNSCNLEPVVQFSSDQYKGNKISNITNVLEEYRDYNYKNKIFNEDTYTATSIGNLLPLLSKTASGYSNISSDSVSSYTYGIEIVDNKLIYVKVGSSFSNVINGPLEYKNEFINGVLSKLWSISNQVDAKYVYSSGVFNANLRVQVAKLNNTILSCY